MKRITLAAAMLLALGLTTTAAAQMMGKCNGSGMQGTMPMQKGMMMNGNMQHDRMMMMRHLDNIKTCVNNAKTTQALNACNMQMRRGGPMMQNRQKMQQGNMPMQNGMGN
jgi:hypothetical protein